MALQECPLFSSEASYNYDIPLESVVYGFTFNWNKRTLMWHLTISRLESALVVLTLSVNNWLLQPHRAIAGLPPGDLILSAPRGAQPGFATLAECSLIYMPAADFAAQFVQNIIFTP